MNKGVWELYLLYLVFNSERDAYQHVKLIALNFQQVEVGLAMKNWKNEKLKRRWKTTEENSICKNKQKNRRLIFSSNVQENAILMILLRKRFLCMLYFMDEAQLNQKVIFCN